MAQTTRNATIQGTARDFAAGDDNLPRLWGGRSFWQIRLRWWVAPAIFAAVLVGRRLGFDFHVRPILLIAIACFLYNAALAWFFRRYEGRLEREPELDRLATSLQVWADYAALFLIIYHTGGVSSPLAIFLIFHVIIGAIQFSSATAYQFAALAAGGLWVLLLGREAGWIHCSGITWHGEPVHFMDRPAFAVIYLLFFSATLFLTAALVTRIMGRLRQGVGALAAAYETIESLLQERAEFTLEVAHNLRAPLGASLSMLDLVASQTLGEVNDRQSEYLERVDGRLRALDQTVGDLLTIGRTRDWSREIPDVVVDLQALAQRIETTFRPRAEEKKIDFTFVTDEELPEVDSGGDLLDQVMENLVSNAIKYTPGGGAVTVRIGRHGSDDVRITVQDNGIGIPEAEQEKLFREFFRASNAKRVTRAGTGLGLALVKKAVERHRGKLHLASAEGEGTTVTVELPVRQEARPQQPSE